MKKRTYSTVIYVLFFGALALFALAPPALADFTGPYESQNWSNNVTFGPLDVSINPETGPSPFMEFSYEEPQPYDYTDRLAAFNTVAAHTGKISFDWEYEYFHCWNQAYRKLMVYTDGPSGMTVQTLVDGSNGPDILTGSASIDVNDGYEFGIEVGGRHYDSSMFLEGKVTLTNFSETYFYFLPYFVGHTNHWTGIGLRNANASSSATVDVFVYDTNGNVLQNDTISIAARGHDVFTIGDGQPNEGWIKIDSTQPLVGLCFVATTGTQNYMADIPFASELSTLLYVPHVGQGPVYDTCVMVCNPNATDTIVTLTFVDQQGNPLYTKSQTVNANGSWKYELKNLLDSSTANYGSVEISASNGLAAFALYDNRKNDGYSYAGISAVIPPGVNP